MDIDTLAFFGKMPSALPLYECLTEKLNSALPEFKTKVQSSQISFYNKHLFACISLPRRKIKDRPTTYLVVTFGLESKLDSRRIAESVEPYPRRWTHHVIVSSCSEIDDELIGWISNAYTFALFK